MNIKITADSTCDLPISLLQRHHITLLPLYVNLGTRCLRDGVDVCPDDIYAHVDSGGAMCTTSACNITDYLELFTELSKNHDAVIHINLGSDFSSSYQNARLAASNFDNVYVVDSHNLCAGQGLMVLRCAELIEQGLDALSIVEKLNRFAGKIDSSFILSQLEYLKKGGRCSSIVALGANLLNLKPCIEVTDGKMAVGKKYRGAFEKAVEQFIRDRLSDFDAIDTNYIVLAHSGLNNETIALAEKIVRERIDCKELIITRAGCTVSSHCGPGTFGFFLVRK